jgi:hypothetical protein
MPVISVEDVKGSGHPQANKTDHNVDRVKEFVLGDRRITILMLLKCWQFHFCHFREGLRINMHCRVSKFVTHLVAGTFNRALKNT